MVVVEGVEFIRLIFIVTRSFYLRQSLADV